MRLVWIRWRGYRHHEGWKQLFMQGVEAWRFLLVELWLQKLPYFNFTTFSKDNQNRPKIRTLQNHIVYLEVVVQIHTVVHVMQGLARNICPETSHHSFTHLVILIEPFKDSWGWFLQYAWYQNSSLENYHWVAHMLLNGTLRWVVQSSFRLP